MNTSQWTRLVIAAVLGLAWLAIVWFGKTADPGMPDILSAIKLTLAGLVGHLMGDNGNVQPVPAQVGVKQGGRAMLRLLIAIAAGALLMLTGCAAPANSAYAGIESAAHKDIAGSVDNAVKTMADGMCDLPRSGLQRNPSMAAAADLVCGPMPPSPVALTPAQSNALVRSVIQTGAALMPGAAEAK